MRPLTDSSSDNLFYNPIRVGDNGEELGPGKLIGQDPHVFGCVTQIYKSRQIAIEYRTIRNDNSDGKGNYFSLLVSVLSMGLLKQTVKQAREHVWSHYWMVNTCHPDEILKEWDDDHSYTDWINVSGSAAIEWQWDNDGIPDVAPGTPLGPTITLGGGNPTTEVDMSGLPGYQPILNDNPASEGNSAEDSSISQNIDHHEDDLHASGYVCQTIQEDMDQLVVSGYGVDPSLYNSSDSLNEDGVNYLDTRSPWENGRYTWGSPERLDLVRFNRLYVGQTLSESDLKSLDPVGDSARRAKNRALSKTRNGNTQYVIERVEFKPLEWSNLSGRSFDHDGNQNTLPVKYGSFVIYMKSRNASSD